MSDKFGLIFLLILVGALALLWLYGIVDCWRRIDLRTGEKVAWTLALFVGNGLGLICYFGFRGRNAVYRK